ncbi:hypothetical protein R1flu_003240 [Riccia fluitans]|uniref:Photosystem II protein L n=1 Tax=Riccia fluitans TaxID=41844 RepID=A0ABD1Y8K6_9MARC
MGKRSPGAQRGEHDGYLASLSGTKLQQSQSGESRPDLVTLSLGSIFLQVLLFLTWFGFAVIESVNSRN